MTIVGQFAAATVADIVRLRARPNQDPAGLAAFCARVTLKPVTAFSAESGLNASARFFRRACHGMHHRYDGSFITVTLFSKTARTSCYLADRNFHRRNIYLLAQFRPFD
jgi:hypothetical protein